MQVVTVRGQLISEWVKRPHHVYVGRRVYLRAGRNAGHAWLQSALANPFRLGDVPNPLEAYEEWLREGIERRDPDIMAAMNGLTPASVLGCWCCNVETPRTIANGAECHAEVIATIWDEIRKAVSRG